MKSSQNKTKSFDQKVLAYILWILKWRWAVVVATLLIAFVIGSAASGLYFDTNYRAFFSDDNPQLNAFEKLQNIYTKNDNILFVLIPKDRKVFSSETLSAVEKLTVEAWKVPFAIRVDAVTNFQHTRAEDDDLIVEDLIIDAQAQSAKTLRESQTIAVNEPFLRNRLINPEATSTGVNVTLQLTGDAKELPKAVAHARKLAEEIRREYPGIEVYLTGIAMLNNAFMEVSQNELGALMPIMFLAMCLVMIFFLRSISGTIATMLLLMLSVTVAMGIGGFFGIGLTPPSAQAPTIILTLAIADGIHILVSMFREMRRGSTKSDAIAESIRINFSPVFLTSLSTVIGFLSLNFSDVPPFNHLGNITAIGVTAAFILSVTFLPALVAILPIRARVKIEEKSSFMEKLADFVILHRRILLWGSAAIMLILTAFIPLNVLDDRFVEYFDQRITFRNDTDFATENLTGIYQIEFSLGGGESGGISNPEYQQKVEEFANWYRQQPNVVHINSFTDVMKRLNKNMHGDDPAYYRLPDSRELAAQYLLLYEMSLPYGLDLNNQINVDKSATRFTVTLSDIGSDEIRDLSKRGEQWLKQYAPEEMHAIGSGPMVMFAHISGINIQSMLTGSIFALALISLLMIFALRSTRLGLISFVPNMIPAAVAFGIWGLTSGIVNLGLSIVIGMTMGIVVDDSIHFLSKYRRARREKNMSETEAVRYTFSNVGRALTVTSVILVIGFGILATSAFDMNASMGKMTAITIALALIADFFFLPPLLMLLDRKKPAKLVFISKPKQAELPEPAFNTINKQ
jgi:predicted RND superfamily exporter protein